jgi:predicted nuclease of restriction endonuclease-like (RecB) superfamily
MKKPVTKSKPPAYPTLITDIGALLEESRHAVARAANCFMTATYWEIGRRIVEFEQGGKRRAEYGEELLERLSCDLTARHGRGFGVDNLQRFRVFFMLHPFTEIYATLSRKSSTAGFAEIFHTLSEESSERRAKRNSQTLPAKSAGSVIRSTPSGKSDDQPIYATLSRKFTQPDWGEFLRALAARFPLPWSHYVKLLTVKDEKARAFYEEEALRGGWSVRQLDRQIGTLFYERTLLSKNKATMLRKGAKPQPGDALTAEEAVRDPLVLEFLNLRDEYSETDLEDALVRHLEAFLLELGGDFTFVGRQRRLRIDDEWYRVDLLFFHRRLRCLVIVDLKLGKFTHADAGQMHLYLSYAKEHWTHPDENPPVGLILCSSAGESIVRYTLDTLPSKIMAREYQLALPAVKKLEAELAATRKRLERVGRTTSTKTK